MSAHEEDAGMLCSRCGVTFDVHEALSPGCRDEGDVPVDGFDAFIRRCESDSVNATPPRPDVRAFEAGLADQARVDITVHPLHPYSCPDCGRPVRHLGFDGRCNACVGIEAQEDAARKRENRRWLHRCTAELLRKIGRADRAAYYDAEAER